MADHMQDALAKLLDDYDARRRGDLEREQKSKDEEAHFLSQFAELRRGVIRPVFEAAGTMLEARGHRYSISEQESSAGSAGRISEAGISLRVVALGTKATLHEDQQSLTVTTRHYNKTVWINSGDAQNSGGIAGAKGAYELHKVTRELVEAELIAFIARVVAH
jgi:hypothetical protein